MSEETYKGPQSEEFESQNQFRVVLQEPERIYEEIRHPFLRVNDVPAIHFGSTELESGLLSRISIELLAGTSGHILFKPHPREGYSLHAKAQYRDKKNSYWQPNEIQDLQELLAKTMGKRSVRHLEIEEEHYLTMLDVTDRTRHVISLGYTDEKVAWKKQVQSTNESLLKEDFPMDMYIFKGMYEDFLKYLTDTSNPIIPNQLEVIMEVAKTHSIEASPTNKLPSEEQQDFIRKMQRWTAFLEHTINIVSKVKGTPQTGLLTLRPSY